MDPMYCLMGLSSRILFLYIIELITLQLHEESRDGATHIVKTEDNRGECHQSGEIIEITSINLRYKSEVSFSSVERTKTNSHRLRKNLQRNRQKGNEEFFLMIVEVTLCQMYNTFSG